MTSERDREMHETRANLIFLCGAAGPPNGIKTADWRRHHDTMIAAIDAALAQARAEEREACAKLMEKPADPSNAVNVIACKLNAAAIRARAKEGE